MEHKQTREQVPAFVQDDPPSCGHFIHCSNSCEVIYFPKFLIKYSDYVTLSSASLPARNPKPAIFYGREGFVDQAIDVILSENGAHLAILGPGGIGKTAIARTILHDKRIIQAFKKNRHFISCETVTSPALLV